MGGLGCYGVTLAVFLFNNVLVLFVPVLLLWLLLLGLTLGPAIVSERQNGTWQLLRTTPLTLDALILGRTSGALWWLRDLIRAMTGILWVVAIGVGMVTMVLTPVGGAQRSAGITTWLLCLGILVLPVICAGIYFAERAQQFALITVGGLALSASARSTRGAMTAASALAISIWLADASIAAMVITVHPGATAWAWSDWLALLTLGPVAGYLSDLPILTAIGAAVATLVLREVIIRVLWRWTLFRAAQDD